MQPTDLSSEPKHSFRPRVGDIIASNLTREKATFAVVLNVYEDILGERVYRIQSVLNLLHLNNPVLIDQAMIDLIYYPATRQGFRDSFKETMEWYRRERNELYETIRIYVEDTASTGPTRPVRLEVRPRPLLKIPFVALEENDFSERSFRPCVGDILMQSIEPNIGTCAVVLNILEDAFGERVYHLQTTLNLATIKGPEQLTQAQLDTTTYHLTTQEIFHEVIQGQYDWYQHRQADLYEPLKHFIEETDGPSEGMVNDQR